MPERWYNAAVGWHARFLTGQDPDRCQHRCVTTKSQLVRSFCPGMICSEHCFPPPPGPSRYEHSAPLLRSVARSRHEDCFVYFAGKPGARWMKHIILFLSIFGYLTSGVSARDI